MAVNLQPITLNYLFESRKFLVLSILAGVISVGLLVFATIPQAQAIFDLIHERSTEQATLIRLQKKSAQLQTVTDPQIQSQSNLVNLLLPNKKPLIQLLGSMNNSSVASQVKITQVQLNPGAISTDSAELATEQSAQSGSAGGLEVTVTIEGTLAQINAFFASIEKTTPLITITQLSLDPISRDSTQVAPADVFSQTYDATLTLNASYFTQSVTSNVDADLPQVSVDEQKILSDLTTFTQVPDQQQQQIVGGGLQDLFGLQAPALVQQQ